MTKAVRVGFVLLIAFLIGIVMVSCGGKTQQAQTPPAKEDKAVSPTQPPTQVSDQQGSQKDAKSLEQPAQPGTQAQPSVSEGTPKIEAVEPVYDFGEVPNIDKVEHDFVIKNVGTGVLQISRVSTTCGCTVAQPEKKELQPGESTVVKATLNLTGRSGPISKSITVFSNDPDTPQLNLEFRGTAKSLIAMEPDRLVQFGEFPAEEKPEPKTVEIKSLLPELKFNITKVDMGEDNPFDYKLETVEEGKHYKITFSLARELPINQNIFKRVTIQTDANLEGKPEATNALRNLMITLAARALGPIEIQPPTLTVRVGDEDEAGATTPEGQQKPGTSFQYIRVRGIKDKEFKITEVVPPVPEISVEINQREQGDYILKVSNIPRDESLNGKKLIIKTTSQYAPELQLEIKTIKYPPRAKLFSPTGITPPPPNISEAMKKMIEQQKKGGQQQQPISTLDQPSPQKLEPSSNNPPQ
ncbi:MAG: DUF1573 domain-containing protein [Candidatus Hydrogenedentes bacterium]|nr:DUF1573 domain-containing protein [Candidatus Hydrogenedentota bacterium]